MNEGKNLINENPNDNFDSSTNKYENKYQKKQPFKKMNERSSTSSKRSLKSSSKEKNIKSSKGLKSELNNYNNNMNNNLTQNKKENILTSSFAFYKENIFISVFKKLYSGAKQKYISIVLLGYSFILFLLSITDLMKKIQKNKKNSFLLNNLIIFILEMICSCLIICFHLFYYFINIGNNYIIFLIMSITILIFSLLYLGVYLLKKNRLFEIILFVIYNLLLVVINLIYLFLSYHLVKQNNKMQQNIEDIMNFSLRNEKIPDFSEKEGNKDNKKKVVALVEEEK